MTTFAELPEKTLRLCVKGDPKAIMKFIEHYRRPVHYFLWRCLGPGPHVDDLAQDTFLRAVEALPQFDIARGKGAWSWLRTIALNCVIDWKRKKANGESPSDALDDLVPVRDVTPENAACLLELRDAIQYAIDQLDERSRAVFELAVLDGVSIKKIAEKLDMAEGTVKSRLSRAREALRELLKDWGGWVL